MRFHFNWFLVLALVACPAVWGQQEGEAKQDQAAQAAETQDDEKELTVAEKFREIQGAQRKMMVDLGNEFRAARGDQAAQAEIMQQRRTIETELANKALALVGESDDDDLSVQILVFVSNFPGETQAKATDLLMNKYITSPAMGMLAGRLARQQAGPKTEGMLRAIIEKNKNPEVQGQATMALASYLGGLTKIAAADDQSKQQAAARMGEGGTAYLEKWTTKAIEAARIKLLETCVEKYGDISMGRRTIGQTAEGQLFVLKYLQIGKVAPDIEGSDLDEVAFKLSDYRGKVVVLDFWGDW